MMSSSNNGHKVSYKRCQNVVIIIAESDARFDARDASSTVVEDDGRAPLLKKPNHRPRARPSSRTVAPPMGARARVARRAHPHAPLHRVSLASNARSRRVVVDSF